MTSRKARAAFRPTPAPTRVHPWWIGVPKRFLSVQRLRNDCANDEAFEGRFWCFEIPRFRSTWSPPARRRSHRPGPSEPFCPPAVASFSLRGGTLMEAVCPPAVASFWLEGGHFEPRKSVPRAVRKRHVSQYLSLRASCSIGDPKTFFDNATNATHAKVASAAGRE